jgi:hypothetical protein
MADYPGLHLYYWLKQISSIVPPLCVEVFLKNNQTYFLNSVCYWEDTDPIAVLRIWDLREMSGADIGKLKETMNNVKNRDEYGSVERIHPKLDWANLRVPKEHIAYVIEWHDRMWPRELIGFQPTK